MHPNISHPVFARDFRYTSDKSFRAEIPGFSSADFYIMRWRGEYRADRYMYAAGVTPVLSPGSLYICSLCQSQNVCNRGTHTTTTLRFATHYFALRSDDGSRLYMNQRLVVNNDGKHAGRFASAEHLRI